jgi:methyl-accepting chemotaxis protein
MRKLDDMKIGTKISGAFAVVLLLMVTVGGYGVYSINKVNEELHFIEVNAYPVADSAGNMKFATVQVQQWLTDASATGWDDGFAEAEAYAVQFRTESAKLKEIYKDEPKKLKELQELDKSFETYYAMGVKMAKVYIDKGRDEGNKVMKEFDTVAEDLSGKMGHIAEEGDTQLVQSTARVHELGEGIKKMSIALTILAVILAILITFVLTRALTEPINKLVDVTRTISKGDLTKEIEVASSDEIGELADSFRGMVSNLRDLVSRVQGSAQRVAATSQELAASSEEMTATTTQVSTTVQQIAAGAQGQSRQVESASQEMKRMAERVHQISEKARAAAETSGKTEEIAKVGGEAAKEATVKMNEIHVVVNDSATVVKELGERSQRIGEIVDLITGIAEQTNLLALNAAIEAARAGEHGRGFAVVAEEVRKLAEGSAKAAEEIGGLIRDIQVVTDKAVESMEKGTMEVAEGGEIVNKALVSLEDIVGAVNETVANIQEISSATQEQTTLTESITKAVEDVAATAEEAAAGTEEASAAAEEQTASMEEISSSAQELSALALQLQEATSRFKLNGKGVHGKPEVHKPLASVVKEPSIPSKAEAGEYGPSMVDVPGVEAVATNGGGESTN